MEFKQWLALDEIGQASEPAQPESPPATAMPNYTLDGSDLPPTPKTNRQRRAVLDRRRRRRPLA